MDENRHRIVRKLLSANQALRLAQQGVQEAQEGVETAERNLTHAQGRIDPIQREVSEWTERYQTEFPSVLAEAARIAKHAGTQLMRAQTLPPEIVLGAVEAAEENLRTSLRIVTAILGKDE